MPLISDTVLFPISSFVSGCTVLGTLNNAQKSTVQFDFLAVVSALQNEMDVIHYEHATKAGQTVFFNRDPNSPDFPSINSGRECLAEIINYPPAGASDFKIIYKLLT